MAKDAAELDWIPESLCPVIPASGYYAVDIITKPQIGSIINPAKDYIVPGGIAVVRIVAIPPEGQRSKEDGYKFSGNWKVGDIIYVQMPIDMKGEKIEHQEEGTRKIRSFYLISEGRILGRHRWPEKMIEQHKEQTDG